MANHFSASIEETPEEILASAEFGLASEHLAASNDALVPPHDIHSWLSPRFPCENDPARQPKPNSSRGTELAFQDGSARRTFRSITQPIR
jgi:hypothetical protein